MVRHHEPDRVRAGSDLGPVKTRAEREGDHYRILVRKSTSPGVITTPPRILSIWYWPGCPMRRRAEGISLIVPKYLVNPDGSLGARNDAYRFPPSTNWASMAALPVSWLMGTTTVPSATSWERRTTAGLYFTMMNEARLKVGLQGIGASEGAYQKAVAYARERVQGGVAIIEHADVKRMLTTMRALIEAMRALAYTEAVTMDLAHYRRGKPGTRTVVAST